MAVMVAVINPRNHYIVNQDGGDGGPHGGPLFRPPAWICGPSPPNPDIPRVVVVNLLPKELRYLFSKGSNRKANSQQGLVRLDPPSKPLSHETGKRPKGAKGT